MFADVVIAFARRIFEPRAVFNPHFASVVGNEPGLLQHACGNRNARTPRPQHVRQEFVRERNEIAIEPVLAHQQPSCESLVHFVQAVAGSDLSCLHRHRLAVLLYSVLQHRAFAKDTR